MSGEISRIAVAPVWGAKPVLIIKAEVTATTSDYYHSYNNNNAYFYPP